MDPFIKALRQRMASVQARIEQERGRPAPDRLRLGALKRLKRLFRDQIELIERLNRGAESMPIPVVRRRLRRPFVSCNT